MAEGCRGMAASEAMEEVVDGKTSKEEEDLVIASLPNSFNVAGRK